MNNSVNYAGLMDLIDSRRKESDLGQRQLRHQAYTEWDLGLAQIETAERFVHYLGHDSD
jgi:hypothetical protein